tara:strand:- start:16222 stop:16356 length:135 start_codon:yes stop_codon:yes gene_type:complete
MNPRTARLRRHGSVWRRHRVLIMVGGGFAACFLFVALGREAGWF